MTACVLLLAGAGCGEARAAAGWDCQQGGKDGKEWVCVAGKGKPQPTPKPQAPAAEPAAMETPARSQTPVESVRPQTLPAPATPAPVMAKPAPFEREQALVKPAPPTARPAETPARREVPLKRIADTTPTLESAAAKAPASGQKPGWNCRAGAGKEWDCALVGADPGGLSHVVGEAAEATPNWAEASTITREDELRFKSVMARLPDDPWRLGCSWRKNEFTQPTAFLMTPADRLLREKAPLEVTSDYAEFLHGEVSDFKGTVDLARADQRLYGDFVTRNSESDAVSARGNVIYLEKGLAYSSDTAFMRLKTDQGLLRNTQFIIETVPSRGTSRVTHIDSNSFSRYETLTYTACPPGNQDWMLHARSAKINKETGRGSANHAWLEFKGVPFFYTPYMSFPIDDRRQSGFLTPAFGNTRTGGFDLSLPYYFNLAPDYDATFWPRWLSNRGEMLRGEFRYLEDWARGRMIGEYVPHDQLYGGSRGQFGLTNDSNFSSIGVTSHLDVHTVSDPTYLNQLGNLLSIPLNTYIRSWGNVIQAGQALGGGYSVSVLGDYFQPIDPTILKSQQPYYHMPQFTFSYDRGIAGTGLMFQGVGDWVSFANASNPAPVTGQRMNLRPRLYYPLQSTAGFVTPSMTLQQTSYWLDLPQNPGAVTGASPGRTVPIFSIDSGAYFEREFQLGKLPMQQTLEPRLFYLYVPAVNQNKLPTFDTGEFDFNFYQLFRENRFSGTDRIAQANQLTPALTSRFIDQEDGLERLRLSIGEIFYFTDPSCPFANGGSTACFKDSSAPGGYSLVDPKAHGKSNVVGEVSSAISDNWSVRTTGQWNPAYSRLDRTQVGLQYNDHANNVINLSYRFRRNPTEYPITTGNITVPPGGIQVQQTDVSFRLPVMPGWHLLGRWQYSLLNDTTSQAFVGVERENCCWRISLIGLHYLNGTAAGVANPQSALTNDTVFVQFELKGLGRLGEQIDQFLGQNIGGYRTANDIILDPNLR